MTYNYLCDKCAATKDIEASIKDGPPKEVFCDACGEKMHRDWATAIHIPDYMKAGQDATSPRTIGNQLNKSRPSGKKKLYY